MGTPPTTERTMTLNPKINPKKYERQREVKD
jgi:hypothetical protein